VKHSERGSKFWGVMKGTEEQQNNKANEILQKMLDDCVWINIHFLPHSIQIIELRNNRGYGMRWQIGGEFRGLIEPEIEEDDMQKNKH